MNTFAGEYAATVLLCQLSYMSHEENMAGLEPAPFEGTVVFTTGEGGLLGEN